MNEVFKEHIGTLGHSVPRDKTFLEFHLPHWLVPVLTIGCIIGASSMMIALQSKMIFTSGSLSYCTCWHIFHMNIQMYLKS